MYNGQCRPGIEMRAVISVNWIISVRGGGTTMGVRNCNLENRQKQFSHCFLSFHHPHNRLENIYNFLFPPDQLSSHLKKKLVFGIKKYLGGGKGHLPPFSLLKLRPADDFYPVLEPTFKTYRQSPKSFPKSTQVQIG